MESYGVEENNTSYIIEEENAKSKAKARVEAGDLTEARMINSTEPKTFEQIYADSKADLISSPYKDLMDQEARLYAEQQRANMLGVAAQGASVEDTLDLVDGATAVVELMEEDDAAYAMRTAALPKEVDLDAIAIAEESTKQYAFGLIAEQMEQESGFETTLNYLGLLAPDETKDLLDAFGSVEEFEKFKESFRSLGPEQKQAVIPDIISLYNQAFDANSLDMMHYMQELFEGNNYSQKFAGGVLMDALAFTDLAAIGKAAVKATKLTALRRSTGNYSKAQQAQDVGAIEAAVTRQAAAGKSDEVAEAVGTNKMDVAASFDPHSTRGIDNGTSLDGVAGAMGTTVRSKAEVFPEGALLGALHKIPSAPFKLAADPLNAAIKSVTPTDLKIATTNASRERMFTRLSQEARIRSGDLDALAAPMADAVARELAIQRALKPQTNKVAQLPQEARVQEEMGKAIDETAAPVMYNEDEVYEAIDRTYTALRKEMDQAGQGINTLSVAEVTPKGITWKVDTLDGTFNRTMRYTKEDTGVVVANADPKVWKRWQARLAQGAFSPDFLLRPTNKHLVDSVTFAGQQGAKLKNKLAKIWKDTEAGLSKKENLEVNAVLQVGDEAGEELYSFAHLRSGLETSVGKIEFNTAQYNSYVQKRAYFRKLHSIKNVELRDQLAFDGYKAMSVAKQNADGTWGAHLEFAKPFASIEAGLAKMEGKVLIKGRGTQSALDTAKEAAKLEQHGWKLVELHSPVSKHGKDVKYQLVKSDVKWRDLPANVLHYQDGYVPRIYKPGYHFVRDMSKSGMGIRMAFETKADAMAYKLAEEAKDPNAKLAHFVDGEFSRDERLLVEADAYGGLITGQRKNTLPTVLKDGNEHALERMSVGEATDRYLHNIASVVPLNEYRSAAVARWENDVNALLEKQGRDVGGKVTWRTPDEQISLDKETKALMLGQRKYVQEQMGMVTKEESVFRDLMVRTADYMGSKGWDGKTRDWMLWHADAHPNDFLKASSFNLMLGMFNVRQVFVQMQNASLALSMYPKYAVQSLPEGLAARMYIMTKDPKARQAILNKLSKEQQEFVKQFDESGMVDAIARQGDLNHQSLGVAPGTMDAAKKFIEKGRIPFNEGEIFSRAVSFSVARRKLIAEGKPHTTAHINEEALRINMNMQTENAAWWQNAPVIGLATQFLQVQAKFAENLLPTVLGGTGRWSAAEKSKVLAGQLILYGVVGVPVAQEAVNFFADKQGVTPQEFMDENPTFVNTINEGFAGMIAEMLGAGDAEFTSSFSLLAGMDDNVVSDVFKGVFTLMEGGYTQDGFLETAAGPSATTLRRFGGVVDSFIDGVKAVVAVPTLEVAAMSVADNIDSLAQLTSTWSNARKVMLLQELGAITSSSGKVIAREGSDIDIVNLQTKFAMAMGFKHDVESLAYMNADVIDKNAKMLRDIKNDFQQQVVAYSLHGNIEYLNAHKATIFAGLSPSEKANIMDQVISDLVYGNSKVSKDLQKAVNQIMQWQGELELTAQQEALRNKVK